jgi:hypothetical protein
LTQEVYDACSGVVDNFPRPEGEVL